MLATAATALVLLHGAVSIGPTTPVCQAGVPCSKPAAHVALTFTRGASVVIAKTDARGRYRVSLRAGVWQVHASAGMWIKPATFTVPRAATATRNFAIDTGIR
ncbi:MAG TPA: hypothetical protein VFJ78_00325 [Gaiellaceae bacterium]|nr:hypothetical protein [Gaiellaceae bacterium]